MSANLWLQTETSVAIAHREHDLLVPSVIERWPLAPRVAAAFISASVVFVLTATGPLFWIFGMLAVGRVPPVSVPVVVFAVGAGLVAGFASLLLNLVRDGLTEAPVDDDLTAKLPRGG